MNGNGEREKEVEKMEEENDEEKRYKVLMWGYLPGVFTHKSPLNSPVAVQSPETGIDVQSWKDVCGGGCGFAMAISGYILIFSLNLCSYANFSLCLRIFMN